MVNYESVLLSLNASGKLAEQLEIIYPRDGIIESDYPLLLLDSGKRDGYDRAVAWLKSAGRPAEDHAADAAATPRPDGAARPAAGGLGRKRALLPDEPAVVDKLLADYADPTLRQPTGSSSCWTSPAPCAASASPRCANVRRPQRRDRSADGGSTGSTGASGSP
jgi:Ca-activated chloride channel family protein